MVRRYEESIEVRTPAARHAGGEEPDAFLWRGRIYLVREVIDHWQERRAWWRDPAGEDGPAAAGTEGDTGLGERAGERERRVWRVAASPGRLAGTGVYDLGADGDPSRWLLLRSHD